MASRLRVLVVDDDAAVGEFVSRWLALRGCEVARAADRRGALRIAAEGRFDAALLDVDLGPGGSGLELAGALKGLHPGLRVVLMSGDPANETRVAAAGLGPMLLKPFSPAELDGAIG